MATFLDSLLGAQPTTGYTNSLPTTGTKPAPMPTPPAAEPAPAGFTAAQWAQLQQLAKKNPKIADLMKQYQAKSSTSAPDPWRRVMPTDTSQLLKQLSYNAGEMGMPGGYVGAIQLPAYGETQPPVNNPDMSKYGQTPGLGEATFYQQSMKGGMAPIAAMSPLGVPADWNPGGGSGGGSDLQSQLKDYVDKITGGGGHGGAGNGGSMKQQMQASFDQFIKNSLGGGFQGVFAGFPGGSGGFKKKPKPTDSSGSGSSSSSGSTTGTKPGRGVPISLPYGY